MILAKHSSAEVALAAQNRANYFIDNPFPLLLEDPDAELVFMLVANPLQRAHRSTTFPYAVASRAIASLDASDRAGVQGVYLTDRDFKTRPTDNPANQGRKRLSEPFHFESRLPLPGSGRALGSIGAGVIRIANADRELDDLIAASWEGRDVLIKVGGTTNVGRAGERTLLWPEFGTIRRGTVESLEADEIEIRLALRDPMAQLEKPLQSRLYAGTGGLEGTAQIKGLPRPLAFGRCRNVEAVLVDPTKLIFQFHDGSMKDVLSLRDKGAPLSFEQNVANIETAAPPTPGYYITARSTGHIRLSAQPVGAVTGDIEGDNTGGYVSDVASIVRRIATRYGGLVDPGQIDAQSFAEFPPLGVVGYFSGLEPVDVDEVLAFLMFSTYGWATFRRDGRLRIGPFISPESAANVTVVEDIRILPQSVSSETAPLPAYRVRVGYRRNWMVQSADTLAGELSVEERARYAAEQQYEVIESSNVRDQHPMAQEVTRATILDDQADAAKLAFRIFDCESRRRILGKFVRARALFQHDVGEVLEMRYLPAGFESGRFLVLGLTESGADRRVTLELWGEPGTFAAFTVGETPLGAGQL